MILLIDNYDSFTYNLYQYMGIFTEEIQVVRNDKITLEEIRSLHPCRSLPPWGFWALGKAQSAQDAGF